MGPWSAVPDEAVARLTFLFAVRAQFPTSPGASRRAVGVEKVSARRRRTSTGAMRIRAGHGGVLLQIVGRPQGDLAVLQLAHAYEQAAAKDIRRAPALLGRA